MKALLLGIWFLFLSVEAFAYPEMVRHGYTHCTACHTQLVGGNLLNAYGRTLSRELLSQRTLAGKPSAESDESFLYGTVRTPEWLLLGGDLRVLQAFIESRQVSRARFLIMQLDIDSWARLSERVSAFFSIGRVESRSSDSDALDFVSSPRHGVQIALSRPEQENQLATRIGRFMPAYGIAFAEHTFVTRSLLDFGPGQERYAAELSWTNDSSSVIATAIGARGDGTRTKTETGGVVQAAMAVREKSKVGINYYETRRTDGPGRYQRRIYGLFSHIAFDDRWYGLFEADRPQRADGRWGIVEIFKLGYEPHQGLHLIAIQEIANLDTSQAGLKQEAYSLGAQWFPRPHWDLYALVRKERNTSLGNDFQNATWLIAHFYL